MVQPFIICTEPSCCVLAAPRTSPTHPWQAERGVRVIFSGCGRFEERLRTYRDDMEVHVRLPAR